MSYSPPASDCGPCHDEDDGGQCLCTYCCGHLRCYGHRVGAGGQVGT